MKILLTGDRGYIGSVLVSILLKKGYEVVGLDVGFFEENILQDSISDYQKLTKDIRDIEQSDLDGIDAIIHLAGLSNDPLGDFSPKLTDDINNLGTVRLAKMAKKAGVERFIFSSSQSMYGISEIDHELNEDNSEKNPVTAYAKAKWDAEQEIKDLCDDNFVVTCFRPSTVFGASPRLRCDIVFNNLVACAYTTGKIEILSDGTPWRPVVHVRDVCSAFIAGLVAPQNIVNNRSFNVGIPNGNFTVRDLANAAQKSVPGSELIFTGEHGSDSRTYRVSFDRILTELSDFYKPKWDLEKGGQELVSFFKETGFNENHFRGRTCIRLQQLNWLIDNNKIDNNLRNSY
jgi:nucleoside-diphosphate-sugar epimerase